MARMSKPIIKKWDPLVLCQRQAEECARVLHTIASAPSGSQMHDAKLLHKHAEQAWERFIHWGDRLGIDGEQGDFFAACWTPVMGMVLKCVIALEEHLKAYPDPEIKRFVRMYRGILDDLEVNQTEAGSRVEVELS